MQAVAGAFILLILLCLLGGVLLTGLIFLIVGMVRRNKTNRKYPKVFIVIGVLIWIPFLGMIIYIVIDDRMLDQKEKNDLQMCLQNEWYDYAEKLIENGASPDCSQSLVASNDEAEPGEETVLLHYCKKESLVTGQGDEGFDQVKFLVEHGADIHRRVWEHEPNYEYHYKTKSDISGSDGCGYTPLMVAAKNGNEKVVDYLLEHGANVNDIDYCGSNVLMISVSPYHEDVHMRITKKLIECGADINCKNNYGETIWDLIDFYKIDSTRQMLYDMGYREDE